jgi:hypothetical protein
MKPNRSDQLEKLSIELTSIPPGKLTGETASRIADMLAQSWDNLEGSTEGGMKGDKLLGGRAENLRWDPPILEFQIERHGGRMLGSTRGELQRWQINITEGTARFAPTGHRQLLAMDARMDVKRLARETAARIIDGQQAPQLKWTGPNRVRILVAEVIPATNQQTTASRRKRYIAALEQLLIEQGWRFVRQGSYRYFER